MKNNNDLNKYKGVVESAITGVTDGINKIINKNSGKTGSKKVADKIVTPSGNVIINKDVIAAYAGNVAVKCSGIIEMAVFSITDSVGRIFKKNDITNGIKVDIVDNKIELDFHVIVSYGVNLVAVTENLVSDVKYQVEKFTNIEIAKINVYIEGIRRID